MGCAVLFFLILFYAVGTEVQFLGVEGGTDGITTHEAAGDVFDKLRATFPSFFLGGYAFALEAGVECAYVAQAYGLAFGDALDEFVLKG